LNRTSKFKGFEQMKSESESWN